MYDGVKAMIEAEKALRPVVEAAPVEKVAVDQVKAEAAPAEVAPA